MIPIIVSFWGQKQEKLTLLEDHLKEHNVPAWMMRGRIDVQMLRDSYPQINVYTVLPNIGAQF